MERDLPTPHPGDFASIVVCSSQLAEHKQGLIPRLLCPSRTCQQQQCNHQSPFLSKYQFNEVEDPIPPNLTKKASDARLIHARTLPPIRLDRSRAPQDVPQRASFPHSVLPPLSSTLPEPPLPRPIIPISRDKISTSSRQHEGGGTDPPRTAPLAAMSQLPGPSLPSTRKRLPGDFTLSSNTPALMNIKLHPPSQSVTLGLHTNRPSILSSYSRLNRTPPAAEQPTTSTAQLESFSTTPFSAAGPVSPKAEMAFGGSTSESGTRWGADQMMVLATENGPIQVPLDVTATSKRATEKRRRNATASKRFRQRRKEKEREYAQNIEQLEQQIRQMEKEIEYYRRERDYFGTR